MYSFFSYVIQFSSYCWLIYTTITHHIFFYIRIHRHTVLYFHIYSIFLFFIINDLVKMNQKTYTHTHTHTHTPTSHRLIWNIYIFQKISPIYINSSFLFTLSYSLLHHIISYFYQTCLYSIHFTSFFFLIVTICTLTYTPIHTYTYIYIPLCSPWQTFSFFVKKIHLFNKTFFMKHYLSCYKKISPYSIFNNSLFYIYSNLYIIINYHLHKYNSIIFFQIKILQSKSYISY